MKWFTPFHSLAVIYGVVLLIGGGEFLLRNFRPPDPIGPYVDPVNNFADTFAQLYPQRAENHYHLARRAEASLPSRATLDDLQRANRAAADHYAQCLAAGLRSDENIIYNYAVSLMLIEADRSEVEAAIAQWRRDFPTSQRRDLEARYDEIRRELLRLRGHG